MPVKNFSPSLLKVFEAGSKKPGFEFDCGSEKAAYAFQWRLHNLRREMRKERHWLVPVAESVVVTIRGTKVIVQPPDIAIEDKLEKALKEQAPEVMELPKEVSKPALVPAIENYLKGGNGGKK